eukprot:gene16333-biopygen12012
MIVCVAGIGGAGQLVRSDIASETGCGVLAGLSVCGGLLAVISSQTMVAREPSIAVLASVATLGHELAVVTAVEGRVLLRL